MTAQIMLPVDTLVARLPSALATAAARWPDWMVYLAALCLFHGAMLAVFALLGVSGHTTARKDPSKKLTPKVRIAAYEVVSFSACLYLTVTGARGFLHDKGTAVDDWVYGHSATADHLAHVMTGYQLYNLAVCLGIAEYRTFEFLAHHVTTALLSWCVLAPYVHYYAFWYIGIAELSSVPLALVDVGRYFPAVGQRFPAFNMAARLLFALTFMVVRVGVWPCISVLFWRSNLPYLFGGLGMAGYPAPRRMWVIVLFLVTNFGLTGLQFMWAGKLIKQAKRMLGGGGKKDAKKTK